MRYLIRTFLRGNASVLLLSLVGAISVIGFVYGMCCPRASHGRLLGPHLYIAGTTIDLGKVPRAEVQRTGFLISNTGSNRLVLNEVDCGCNATERRTILIPPGQTKEVIITLDFIDEIGHIERAISFHTNDLKQPRMDLCVMADVYED